MDSGLIFLMEKRIPPIRNRKAAARQPIKIRNRILALYTALSVQFWKSIGVIVNGTCSANECNTLSVKKVYIPAAIKQRDVLKKALIFR